MPRRLRAVGNDNSGKDGRIITLRGKGEVKVGRLRDAIHEAGLTVEEFLQLLK